MDSFAKANQLSIDSFAKANQLSIDSFAKANHLSMIRLPRQTNAFRRHCGQTWQQFTVVSMAPGERFN
jgi:hypothetical protein